MEALNNCLKKYNTEVAEINKSEDQKEMECLLGNLPVLNDYFRLHSKIGQGTFSTVYLATLRNSSSVQKYAVKHLTQAYEESRIQNELRCLREIGGKDNVVPAELCLSNGENCVTFIMPYLAHHRFSDYVIDMDAEETRFYLKNLFIALKRVHSFNIIHRDVKPNNFLYNRETKQFLLVDFGLAQLVSTPNQETSKAAALLDENKLINFSRKRKRSLDSSDDEKKNQVSCNKRMALKLKDNNIKLSSATKTQDEKKNENEKTGAREKGGFNSSLKQRIDKPDIDLTPVKSRNWGFLGMPSSSTKKFLDLHDSSFSLKNFNGAKSQANCMTEHLQNKSFTPLLPANSSSEKFVQIKNSKVMKQKVILSASKSRGSPSTSSFPHPCLCSGKGAVCSICSSRQPMFAPRAGTSGFRPPEVLFKYPHQTTAVDMWASGVIMLCILSGCYPFFNSSSDLASLAEIMTVFGTEPTINVAKKFGRRILCSEYRKEIDLKKLCKRLRARSAKRSRSEKSISDEPKCRECFQTIKDDGCLCRSDEPSNEEKTADTTTGCCRFPDSAYDLLYRLLDLDPTTRITAIEALEHPFITEQQ